MATTNRALAFVSRWFDEATVRRTFEPLIADWQREWQDASPPRRCSRDAARPRRIHLRCRDLQPHDHRHADTTIDLVAGRQADRSVLCRHRRRSQHPDAALARSDRTGGATMGRHAFDGNSRGVDHCLSVCDGHGCRCDPARRWCFSAGGACSGTEAWGDRGVLHAGRRRFRRAARESRMARDSTPAGWNTPQPRLQQLSTVALLTHPERDTAIVPGHYTRAGEIRRELINRSMLSVLPAMFVWLRWTALSQPRRRRFWPLPAALMTAVVVVVFLMTSFAGFHTGATSGPCSPAPGSSCR